MPLTKDNVTVLTVVAAEADEDLEYNNLIANVSSLVSEVQNLTKCVKEIIDQKTEMLEKPSNCTCESCCVSTSSHQEFRKSRKPNCLIDISRDVSLSDHTPNDGTNLDKGRIPARPSSTINKIDKIQIEDIPREGRHLTQNKIKKSKPSTDKPIQKQTKIEELNKPEETTQPQEQEPEIATTKSGILKVPTEKIQDEPVLEENPEKSKNSDENFAVPEATIGNSGDFLNEEYLKVLQPIEAEIDKALEEESLLLVSDSKSDDSFYSVSSSLDVDENPEPPAPVFQVSKKNLSKEIVKTLVKLQESSRVSSEKAQVILPKIKFTVRHCSVPHLKPP